MKKTLRTSLALGAVAAMMLAGCSSNERENTPAETGNTNTSDSTNTGDAQPEGIGHGAFDAGSKIGVALPQQTSENWVLAEGLFNDGLKEAGFEPMVQFANNGASEQQQQIGAMISSGVKVLIIGAVDGGQLGAQVEEAQKQGITVIAYDRLLTNTKDVDMYVAFDPYRVGELQGESLLTGLSELKGEAPYNIELIAGSPDDANSQKFFDGAMSKLKAGLEDGTLKVPSGQTSFDQVATQGWKAENAQSRFSTIMTANYGSDELQGILSPNDTLARAALTAVDQAGKDYTPVATGQDSEVESVKWVLDGRQYSTIYKDTRELVKESINAVVALSKGEQPQINDTESYNNGAKIVPSFLLEPVIVTKANAKEVYTGDPFVGDLVK